MMGFKRDADLVELAQVLDREIAALDRGDTRGALAFLPQKEAILARLDSRSSDLMEKAGKDAGLRRTLDTIRHALARNAARVERARDAAAAMSDTFARLRERNGLGGLYDAGGDARRAADAPRPRLNQEI
jgi:flagellar biosynthesis/type III secretory pathway chaperone